jgi:hypothetical protein
VAVAQGWNSFWHQRRARILDALTADQTSFATFVELVDAARQHGYTPTLIVTVARRRALAQAFDQRMYDLGLSIRAERRS